MDVAVLGTGYVGLVAGTCFSESGNDVYCVDIDQTKIKNLANGIVPFYEPGLDELIKRNTKNKRLKFTTDNQKAIENSKIIFIAVGTPQSENGSSDLRYVLNATQTIAQYANEHKIVVLKSTVPVGTHQKVQDTLKKGSSLHFDVISNPEFLKEGCAVDDFLKPERVVLGGKNPEAIQVLKDLYAPFIRSGNPILTMDNTSAELSKYACNAFLATKISFINEIANLSETVGANIEQVRQVMITDSRIGHKFLYPGAGYGGSCFPKDVQALIATGREQNSSLKILKAVEDVNQTQKEILFQKVNSYFSNTLPGKAFAIWGLAFKPNTDDMRDAPSVSIIKKLLEAKARVRAYDPVALSSAQRIFENQIEYCDDSYSCLKDSDALLIITEWSEFRKPNFQKIKALIKKPIIFDGRNLFDPAVMKKQGFIYHGIGLL